jgi:hypothetical protein
MMTNYEYMDRWTGKKRRAEHRTTPAALDRLREIEAKTIPHWYPTDPFGPDREMWRGGHRDAGITRVCDFYTKRNLWALAAIWSHMGRTRNHLGFVFTSIVLLASKLYR